ncbi:MAG: TlpA disulfide reductase family protein [Nitrososphaerota archaeon]|nr:TlpA family protein disulfide reductase [Aigarchaeota archaeon]MDW8076824.1 TlpA disulfide reductase family protein [Nitrososphaerota archaeon]
MILGLFVVFAVWSVSGILAAIVGLPNLAAKESGLDCLCSPVLVRLFGYYVSFGRLDVNLSFFVPTIVLGASLLTIYVSNKEGFQTKLKRTVIISLIVSFIGILSVIAMVYLGGELGPISQPREQRYLQVEFELLNGEIVTLSNFKGKPLLLEIMSPWCKYCGMQAYELKKIVENYGDTLNVISVCAASGATAKDVALFNEEHGVSWQTGIDPEGRFLKVFGVPGYPYLVLMDKDGNIVRVFVGLTSAETIGKYVEELISQ